MVIVLIESKNENRWALAFCKSRDGWVDGVRNHLKYRRSRIKGRKQYRSQTKERKAPSGTGLDAKSWRKRTKSYKHGTIKDAAMIYLLIILIFDPRNPSCNPLHVFSTIYHCCASSSRNTEICLSTIFRLVPPIDCLLSTLASKSNT
jgi:hypothetical protein